MKPLRLIVPLLDEETDENILKDLKAKGISPETLEKYKRIQKQFWQNTPKHPTKND